MARSKEQPDPVPVPAPSRADRFNLLTPEAKSSDEVTAGDVADVSGGNPLAVGAFALAKAIWRRRPWLHRDETGRADPRLE